MTETTTPQPPADLVIITHDDGELLYYITALLQVPEGSPPLDELRRTFERTFDLADKESWERAPLLLAAGLEEPDGYGDKVAAFAVWLCRDHGFVLLDEEPLVFQYLNH